MYNMMIEFLQWWCQQVGDFLLPFCNSVNSGKIDGLVLDYDCIGARDLSCKELSGKVTLFRRRGKKLQLLARIATASLTTSPQPSKEVFRLQRLLKEEGGMLVLRVPASWLLQQEVKLPLVAESSLYQILSYELTRLTPFKESEIRWGHEIKSRDNKKNRLIVSLVLGVRSRLDPLLDILTNCGLQPSRIEPQGFGAALHLKTARQTSSTLLLCGCLIGVMTMTALLIPIISQYLGFKDVHAQIAKTQPIAAKAEAVQRELVNANSSKQIIVSEDMRNGNILATLGKLTTLLSDDTFLITLTLQSGQLTIEGRSSEAAKLIARLSADTTLHEVEFASPVIHAEGGDTFTLRAKVGIADGIIPRASN